MKHFCSWFTLSAIIKGIWKNYSALDLAIPIFKDQMPHSPDFQEIYKLVLGASHDISKRP